jgi:hypothetical protein
LLIRNKRANWLNIQAKGQPVLAKKKLNKISAGDILSCVKLDDIKGFFFVLMSVDKFI